MRKTLFRGFSSVFAVLLVVLVIVPPASAHVQKTDGDIGAVLHIEPDDNPISGVPNSLVFFFNDKTNRFSLSDCICRLVIKENGQTIHTQGLPSLTPEYGTVDYLFPRPDDYTLQVSGQSVAGKDFQPFTLAYSVRVGPGVNKAATSPFPPLLGAGLGLMVGTILLAAFMSERKYRQRH